MTKGRPTRWTVPALLLLAGCGQAPVLGEFEYARPYGGEKRLPARIEFAAGRIKVGRTKAANLYQMNLRYDPDRFRPIGSYDPDGMVRLGAASIGKGDVRVGRSRALPQTAHIGFAPEPDLELDVLLGAAEAELDLGGLRLSSLKLTTGASRTTISFTTPNPGACQAASVTSGAGQVYVASAGNSGCAEWRFDGGVGKVTIDLDGAWPADARMALNLAVGGVTLHAPKRLGIRVTMEGFLAKFAGDGFTRSEKTYTSAGYDAAARKLEVEVNSAVSGVQVEWK